MSADFKNDIIEIDGFRFSLIWPSLKKVDDGTDWILMFEKDSKELYGGYLKHDTRFLKKYERLKGQ
ncbi:hypothetical protein SAMN04488102_101378 [Alkalibacterium subtropicum]|uniref:Uncharacterized protein n=1 Tax=Alkalibacterium subtropicum TaxID=753702 RepID=A0A1I1F059_9LACT|nr:hypothetical protein SAMN04488102_101378 [Alkalibacterium subtropicum]